MSSVQSQVMEPEIESVSYPAGTTKKQTPQSPSTPPPPMDPIQDLICVGFGPASLAIAIALSDSTRTRTCSSTSSPSFTSRRPEPRVAFLERQPKFAWHAGMQLPGAKMQISLLKDLASPRNPRSHFTFLNYLFENKRLNTFINLDTFTPSRREYEDYLRWCARHFEREGLVQYAQEVLEVIPNRAGTGDKVSSFTVVSRDIATRQISRRTARHVVIAIGGTPLIPREFPTNHPAVVHSSKYSLGVSTVLPNANAPYNIAVVGNGQSAAEIFNDLPTRFPHAKVTLIIKGAALRPSDDSPFVNEVFDPDRVDGVYAQNEQLRREAIKLDKATNYGVVRISLLEHLYEKLYLQRVVTEDRSLWPVQIKTGRRVSAVVEAPRNRLRLTLVGMDGAAAGSEEEVVEYDAVFVATGYTRTAHETMVKHTRSLLPAAHQADDAKFPVSRDYRIAFDEGKVAGDAGIWLQGCNEGTHGLSDTLLSILAVRSGELVNSMFGPQHDPHSSANNNNTRLFKARL